MFHALLHSVRSVLMLRLYAAAGGLRRVCGAQCRQRCQTVTSGEPCGGVSPRARNGTGTASRAKPHAAAAGETLTLACRGAVRAR